MHTEQKSSFILGSILLCIAGFSCSDQTQNDLESQSPNLVAKNDAIGSFFELNLESPCTNPCELSVNSDYDIYEVRYEADGYPIGSSFESTRNFLITYEFEQVGTREIFALALAIDGSVISKKYQNLEVLANEQQETPQNQNTNDQSTEEQSPLNVPYYYQYNNYYSPSATCQNTSIAMVLNYLGVNVTPDDITARHGKEYAKSPAGLSGLSNQYIREWGVNHQMIPITDGTISGMKAALDRGFPVIVHGYFTGYGHVLVVTGYDDQGYYANDPAGQWSEVFKGGYPFARNDQVGKNIYYEREAFDLAISSTNGYNFMPLWYHEIR